MFDDIYKFWYSTNQRRRWEAAALVTHRGRLADWVRDRLDDSAKRDLSNASE